jgi:8-oxo-dGTP pyrophosphatase MutT (NUDIX family)
MSSIERVGSEDIVYQGRIIEVVNQKVNTQGKEQVFEYARRSPGTRLIIVSPENKILLTKEFRMEVSGYDYRLPGGKVFDTLVEYNEFSQSAGDIIPKAELAAKKEAVEEVGIDVEEINHFATSKVGSTVVWDLIYFVVSKYSHRKAGQELDGAGEDIEVVEVTFDEAKEICLDGRMQEDRSVAVLLKYLHSKKQA